MSAVVPAVTSKKLPVESACQYESFESFWSIAISSPLPVVAVVKHLPSAQFGRQSRSWHAASLARLLHAPISLMLAYTSSDSSLVARTRPKPTARASSISNGLAFARRSSNCRLRGAAYSCPPYQRTSEYYSACQGCS